MWTSPVRWTPMRWARRWRRWPAGTSRCGPPTPPARTVWWRASRPPVRYRCACATCVPLPFPDPTGSPAPTNSSAPIWPARWTSPQVDHCAPRCCGWTRSGTGWCCCSTTSAWTGPRWRCCRTNCCTATRPPSTDARPGCRRCRPGTGTWRNGRGPASTTPRSGSGSPSSPTCPIRWICRTRTTDRRPRTSPRTRCRSWCRRRWPPRCGSWPGRGAPRRSWCCSPRSRCCCTASPAPRTSS